MDESDDYRLETKLTHLGNRPHDNHGVVNPPVYHASTIRFPTVAAMEAGFPTPSRDPTPLRLRVFAVHPADAEMR